MTDAEISRRLALAIGYSNRDVYRKAVVWHHTGPKNSGYGWYVFDYRDPAVIWPIAERYGLFPGLLNGVWEVWDHETLALTSADTAAKAVALAVIKAHEAKK